MKLNSVKLISPYQFAFFRILFGVYLLWHFLSLVPYGKELFSRSGVYSDPSQSPTYSFFPNALLLVDSSPFGVQLFLVVLSGLSGLILIGKYRRIASILLWYGFACVVNRNPLISNPSIPYVGLMLLFLGLIPSGEPFSLFAPRQQKAWYFPKSVYTISWFLLAIGYTFSGLVKLNSPSWVDGTAMIHLVTNPLARPGVFRDLFLSLPTFFTAGVTYLTLAGEILFLPLSVSRKGRFIAWLWMCCMHIGVLTMVSFADLSLGMIMIHLFLFDPLWLPARAEKKGTIVIFFDGVCGLCNQAINLLLDEDSERILKFSLLQGDLAQPFVGMEPESMIVVDDFRSEKQKVLRGSDGVFRALDAIGGFWRVVSLLRFTPRPIRDWCYYFIAKNRYRWFGKSDQCRRITPDIQERFTF